MYDEKQIKYLKNGGEIDLPRDPDNWHELAYRSIRWNASTNMWEYFIRPVQQEEEVCYSDRNLETIVQIANRIHQIDDEVVVTERKVRQ